MKRSISSVISTIVLLSVAAGAAAVNVRILEANRSETSVLTVQPAAEVVNTTPTPTASATPTPSATAAVAAPDTVPSPLPVPPPMPNGKRVLGSVAGGDHDDDDDDDEEHGDRHEARFRMPGKFMRLTPEQAGLLRVAAFAQVSPSQARDAANGQGSAEVIARVRDAAQQIGIPLASIAAVTDIPPERGRRHGGDDDHEDEGDDDD